MHQRRNLLIGSAGLALLLAGCGQVSGQGDAAGSVGQGSQAHRYTTIAELGAASTLVIVAEATGATRLVPADAAGTSGDSSTLSQLKVVTVLKGTASKPGGLIELRQYGTGLKTGFEELVRPGRQHLLFLTPFTFGDGTPPAQWASTSADAFHLRTGTTGAFTNHSSDPDSPLPKHLTLDETRKTLAS